MNKARTTSVSIAVTPEEQRIIRIAAAEKGMTPSSFAYRILKGVTRNFSFFDLQHSSRIQQAQPETTQSNPIEPPSPESPMDPDFPKAIRVVYEYTTRVYHREAPDA